MINGSGTFLALTRYISFKKRLKKAFLLFVCKFKKANPEMSAGSDCGSFLLNANVRLHSSAKKKQKTTPFCFPCGPHCLPAIV